MLSNEFVRIKARKRLASAEKNLILHMLVAFIWDFLNVFCPGTYHLLPQVCPQNCYLKRLCLRIIYLLIFFLFSAAKTLGDMVVTVVPPSNAQENWSYTCPICGNAFNDNNDKTKSMNKLVVHIINAHEHENFDNVLNYLDNSCPYNGCLKKFAQRISLKVHILKYHPDYLLGFLKKYNKNLDLKQCLIVNQPQPGTSNVQVAPVVQVTRVNPGSNRGMSSVAEFVRKF